MMTTNLKIGALAVALLGAAALIIQHDQETKRLTAEAAALREQVAQAVSLRGENLRLADQLKRVLEAPQPDWRELMRLRGQATRLRLVEQENAQLKIERERLASQVAQAQPASDLKAVSPPTNTTDLGVVELSDGAPARLDLGAGHDCTIIPTVLADGNLRMVITVETKTADGRVEKLELSQLTARPRQQSAISIGDRMIALTPKLKIQ